MKQHQTRSSRAAALLLAAAALPLTPLSAQDVQPDPASSTPPPVYDATPPTPAPVPEPVIDPAPVPTPAPEATTPPAATATPAPRASAPARTTRATRAAPVRSAAPARAATAAPAAPAPVAETAPVDALPAEAALPPPPMTPPVEAPVETPAPAAESGGSNTTLWVVAGLLLLGALGALFLLMRRRRTDEAVYDDYRSEAYEEPRYDTAMSSSAAMPEAAGIPVAAAPLAAAAGAGETGRPHLDIALRPRRAGVTGEEAKVEFELEIDNHGDAPARDVRVSTWMLPSGASSESESMLIVRDDQSASAAVGAIPAGSEERISRAVALPTSAVDGDAVLPVVVAEARYRLPDGSEARTTTSFAVGVPDGDEFAHFAIDNPSGLHEGVEARQLGEPEHA